MLTQDLMREVRRLQIRTRSRVEGLFAGEYHTAFKGRGIEFADVREYEPGDDVRTIDWNVTARSGRPHIKRFIEERELTVVLAVDLSGSGDFGSPPARNRGREPFAAGPAGYRTKRRLSTEAAAVLALTAVSNNDRAGLCLFTDRVEMFVPPSKGKRHTLRVLRELLNYSPRSAGTDIAAALLHVGRVVPRRSTVFLISDFQDRSDYLEPALRITASRHELIAVQITDNRESELPDVGLVRLIDQETGDSRWVDTASRMNRDAYRTAALRRDSELTRLFARAEVDRIVLRTDGPFVPEFIRYFKLRERRR